MNRTATAICLIVVGAAALAVRLHEINVASIWYDEAFSYELVSGMTWTEMFTVLRNDVHPPLYFVILRLWAAVFGSTIESLRSFSAVTGVLAVVGIYLFTRDLYLSKGHDDHAIQAGRPAGLTAATVLAFMSAHIQWSQDAKMYALTTALIAFSGWFLIRALYDEKQRRMWWAAWALSACASLYTHNYAIFTVFGQCVFLAFYFYQQSGGSLFELRSSKSALNGIAAIFLIGALYLPWIPTLLMQSKRVKSGYWITTPFWSIPYTLDLLLFPSVDGAMNHRRAAAVTLAIAVIVGWLLLLRRAEYTLVVAMIVSPLICAMIVSLTVAPIITPRYFLFSVMFLPTAAALIIWQKRLSEICWMLTALIAFNTAYLQFSFANSLNHGERRGTVGATEFAVSNLTPDQPLIVLNAGIYFSVKYYAGNTVAPVLLSSGRKLPHYLCGSIDSRVKQISSDELDELPINSICVIDSTVFSFVPEAQAVLSSRWEPDTTHSKRFQEVYKWQGATSVTTYRRVTSLDQASLTVEKSK